MLSVFIGITGNARCQLCRHVCVCCVGSASDGVSVSIVCMSAFTVNLCSSCGVSASVSTSGSHESSASACGK